MEEIGCTVDNIEALDLLGHAGCDIADPRRVKIPRQVVKEALEAAPKEIQVFDRDGALSMTFTEDSCYYGTGSDCPTTIDLISGERRESTKKDIENLTQFCDALPNMDFVMSMGIASDAPKGGNFVHQYEAMLLNTKKPIIVTAHGINDMSTIIEMAAAIRGGKSEVKKMPSLILYSEPLSPLIHTDMGVGKCLICCEYEIPFIYIGAAMMGVSAPATLEGALVQTIAEALAGLVIFQRKQPGAKFIFGGDSSVMDMKTSVFCYGSPELNIMNAAIADMAHFYRLPFFCLAGASDSKVLDAQAGMEYALSLYIAALNGCNIIHDCGYLESGLTSSFESILFSDEMIGNIKRLLRPIRIDEETVPFQVMDKVGPGGNFLIEEHTVNTFKDTFWFPRFLDRNVFEIWQKEGCKDVRAALNEKAKEIFNNHKPEKLSESIVTSIREIVANHHPDVNV
jgi:trimethylamine--corrinoid protein Co-methyltransferase